MKTYRWTGHIYHDPSERRITVLGRDGLFPETRVLVEREDGLRWSVDRQRLEAALSKED